MDLYRRKKQISEEDIAKFRQEEIAFIKSEVQKDIAYEKHPLKRTWYSVFVLAFSLLVMMTMFLFIQDDNLLDVDQRSDVEYVVHSSYSGKYQFYLYYKSHIVYENPIEEYDETFGYRQPYRYVPEDVQKTISVDFHIFIFNMYAYFLEIQVDGENRYAQIDYFPSFGQIQFLDDLTITDLEQDILDIYAWIEQYPPIVTESSVFSEIVYVHNPAVDSLPDSIQKQNYIHYVDNHYRNGEDDTSSYYNSGESVPTYVINNLVVLDENNSITENTFQVELTTNTLAEQQQNDFIENRFQFYTLTNQFPFGTMTTFWVHSENGQIIQRTGIIEGKRYAYFLCSLNQIPGNLEDISRVVVQYRLHDIYGGAVGTLDMTTFVYGDFIVIPPSYIVDETDAMIASLFDQITFVFYDFEGNPIYEVTFPQS